MNSKDFLTHHKEFCDKMIAIVGAKNHDYSGNEENALYNFLAADRFTTAEIGLLVRMTDKMSRVESFVKHGVYLVDDEKVEDTLLDLANYAAIMAAVVKEKRGGEKQKSDGLSNIILCHEPKQEIPKELVNYLKGANPITTPTI